MPPAPATPHSAGPPPPSELRHGVAAGLLVAGGLGVVLAATPSRLFDLERYTVPKELVLHGAALAGLLLLAPGWRRLRLAVPDALLVAALLWAAASALIARNGWLAFNALGVSASALAIYAVGRSLAGTRFAALALGGLLMAATAGVATGLIQAYGGQWALFAAERAPGGTFGNRNFLAHVAALALPALVVATAGNRHRAGRLAGAVAVGMAVAVIVLTRSRAAWLAGAGALVMVGLTALRARGWRAELPPGGVRTVAAGVAGALALAMLLPNQLSWRTESPFRDTMGNLVNYEEGSGRGRLIQYERSLELVRRAPVFGVGPGNWFVYYPLVTERGDPAFAGADPIPTNPWPSSDWVAFVTERGPVGAGLLLLAGLAMALTAWRRAGGDDPRAAGAAVALTGVLAALLVTSGLDAVLHLPAPAYFAAALAGLLLPRSGAVVDRPLTGRTRAMALGAPLLFATLLVITAAGRLAAVRIASADGSRPALERAVRLDPGNHRLRLRLAMRGGCAERLPHARAAARLMPFHAWPARLVRACGGGAAGG